VACNITTEVTKVAAYSDFNALLNIELGRRTHEKTPNTAVRGEKRKAAPVFMVNGRHGESQLSSGKKTNAIGGGTPPESGHKLRQRTSPSVKRGTTRRGTGRSTCKTDLPSSSEQRRCPYRGN